MAYNNGFPMSYQQYQPIYQQPYIPQQPQQMQTAQQPQSSGNNIIWVQGEAGAKSYLVAPNNTVQLWDSEKQTIYLKSADASGMPSMKVLDYTIRDTAAPQVVPVQASQNVDYVTRQELAEFEANIRKQLDSFRKEEVKDNE